MLGLTDVIGADLFGDLAGGRVAELLPQVVDEAFAEHGPVAAHVEHEELDVAGAVGAHYILVKAEEQVLVDGLARLPVLLGRASSAARVLLDEQERLVHHDVEPVGQRQLHPERRFALFARRLRVELRFGYLLARTAHVNLEQLLHAYLENRQAELAHILADPEHIVDVGLLDQSVLGHVPKKTQCELVS